MKSAEELELSEKLIKKLQEEDNLLQEEEKKKKETEINKIECQICCVSLYAESNELWGLIACGHCFHKACLNSYFQENVENAMKLFKLIDKI